MKIPRKNIYYKSNIYYNSIIYYKSILIMSVLAIYKHIVKQNNGNFRDTSNKCGSISIGQSMGNLSENYIEIINDILSLGQHEELDIFAKSDKLQEICDIFGFSITIHCAKRLDYDFVRIWQSELMKFNSREQFKSQDIHILWYGGHFEYINWNQLTNYPEYYENIYNQLSKKKLSTNDFMTQYHISLIYK